MRDIVRSYSGLTLYVEINSRPLSPYITEKAGSCCRRPGLNKDSLLFLLPLSANCFVLFWFWCSTHSDSISLSQSITVSRLYASHSVLGRTTVCPFTPKNASESSGFNSDFVLVCVYQYHPAAAWSVAKSVLLLLSGASLFPFSLGWQQVSKVYAAVNADIRYGSLLHVDISSRPTNTGCWQRAIIGRQGLRCRSSLDGLDALLCSCLK